MRYMYSSACIHWSCPSGHTRLPCTPMKGAGTTSAGVAGEYVFDVVGMGIGAATEQFVDLCTSAGYTVVAVGPNRMRLARVYRPAWASAVAVLTAVAAGLGLLFLLVKRTESAEATIVEDRAGIRLRVVGTLTADLPEQIKRTLHRSGVIAPGVAEPARDQANMVPSAITRETFAPSVVTVVTTATDETLHRASLPPPLPHTTAGALLQLAGGRVIRVGQGAVLGRAPAPDPQLPAALLHPINDMSLSKTHLSVVSAADGVLVTDHHSKNGTILVVGEVQQSCAPGQRVLAPFGAQVLAGELRISVIRA